MFPMKSFELLAARLSVVATRFPMLDEFIELCTLRQLR